MKNTSYIDKFSGLLLGFLTFWLYIPWMIKKGLYSSRYVGSLKHSVDGVANYGGIIQFTFSLLFPVVFLLSIPGTFFVILHRFWASGARSALDGEAVLYDYQVSDNESFKTYKRNLPAPHTMFINFLSGLAGILLGPAVAMLLFAPLKTLNLIRQELNILTASSKDVNSVTRKNKILAVFKIILVPLYFIAQLLVSIPRGFLWGKDGLGSLLQSPWILLNPMYEDGDVYTEDDIDNKYTDKVIVGAREIMVVAVYLSILTFVFVALVLTLPSLSTNFLGVFAHTVLHLIGFTFSATTVFGNAMLGAGIFSMLVGVGTLMLSVAIMGLSALAKCLGVFGETVNDVFSGFGDMFAEKSCSFSFFTERFEDSATKHTEIILNNKEHRFEKIWEKAYSQTTDETHGICSFFAFDD